jgi:hypothetical protein
VVRDVDYVRTLPVGVRHVADNCAIPALDPAALRIRRHILLSGCQSLTYPYWRETVDKETGEIRRKSEFRVSVCCRQPIDESVKIYRHDTAVGYSGLMRCGNVWACPICCAKVMRRRADQISALFEAVHASGGSAVMATFTAAHTVHDDLATLLDAFKSAKRAFTQSRSQRDIAALRSGALSATEITYSPSNGWHPHQHDAWFFRGPSPDADRLADALFAPWRASAEKFGLTTLASYRGHRVGVDVRPAWDASEYLAKFDREREWSLSAEMTAGRLKLSQGKSMTPWALLEDAILRGKDSPAAKLWIDYLRATKGKAVVSLKAASALLKSFGMPTTLDDFADANDVGEGEVVGCISDISFDRVARASGLGRLLEAARSGGLAEIDRVLQSDFSASSNPQKELQL